MAVDEAVSEAVSSEKSIPTVRFYSWNPSAVSIGYHQSLEEEVRSAECEERGFDIVRRRTGGGAVFHMKGGEITYSVIAPESVFPKDIIYSYKEICSWLVKSLGFLGLRAEFKPINDVVVNGRKISGNAQTRRRGVLLQHGTLLYDLDVATMFAVLSVSSEKISDKLIKSVEERVTSVRRECGKSFEETCEALWKGFAEGKEIEIGELSEEEINRTRELAAEKYSSKEWNWAR